jgi:hypothetical protein
MAASAWIAEWGSARGSVRRGTKPVLCLKKKRISPVNNRNNTNSQLSRVIHMFVFLSQNFMLCDKNEVIQLLEDIPLDHKIVLEVKDILAEFNLPDITSFLNSSHSQENDPMRINRRCEARIPYTSKAYFTMNRVGDTSRTTKPGLVLTQDISSGGLSFMSPLDLPGDCPDSLYHFRFDQFGNTTGHIVWKKRAGKVFNYGIQFDRVQDRYLAFFRDLRTYCFC